MAMLDKCAPGWTYKEGAHDWLIYHGRERGLIPFGAHAKRGGRAGRAEIQNGHIRKLARQLKIETCLEQHFSSIYQ